LGSQRRISVGFRNSRIAAALRNAAQLCASIVPLTIDLDPSIGFGEFARQVCCQLSERRERLTFPLDLLARRPALAKLALPWRTGTFSVVLHRMERLAELDEIDQSAHLTIAIPDDGGSCTWISRSASSADFVRTVESHFEALLSELGRDTKPVGRLSLLT